VIDTKRWVVPAGLVAAVLGAGVVGGLIADAVSSPGSSSGASGSSGAAGTPGTPGSAVAVGSCDVPTVADQVVPSVVTISASAAGGASGTGSGELIRPDGYILTNNHVISVAAGAGGTVAVLFSDGESAPAAITGRDPQTEISLDSSSV
jgi:putative serine protease PepD